jgi:ribosomal protein L11 methyltransferase
MSTIWRLRIDGPLAPLSAANARLGEHDDQPALGWSLFEDEGDASRGYLELLFADRVREDEWGAALGLEGDAFTVHYAPLPDEDWIAMSLKGLPAVAAGRFVVYGEHERDKLKPGQIGLWIEAGPAFGTGHHGTTLGCLRALDRLVDAGVAPGAVLDLGCGTAVLAMAAAKVWSATVHASDIDPVAVDVARANVAANDLDGRIVCEVAAGFDAPVLRDAAPFDLVFANILKGPLMALARDMAAVTQEGGFAILSGILNEQADEVEAHYTAQGYQSYHRESIVDWTTLTLRKKGGLS